VDPIIIQHRINSIKELDKIPSNLGVEVDIRESNGDLICCHDPFYPGELFKEFLKHFDHKFIIANIKEEGIEKSVISYIKEQGIENYFLLDVSFPYITKLSQEGVNKIALRVSDFEELNLDLLKALNIKWIWLDAFENFPAEELSKIEAYAQNNEIQVCLVSPELHVSRSNLKSKQIHAQIKTIKYKFDAICSKKPVLWQ